MGPFIVLASTLGLTWVLFILPQQRRIKAHQAIVASLEVGDEIMTTSGLFGTVTALDDESFHLEIAPGTVVRFARGAADRRLGDDNASTDNASTDDDASTDASTGADDSSSGSVAAGTRPAGTAADRAVAPRDSGEGERTHRDDVES